MFKSIRWKFITVYFLLVFIAMVIVGVFIVEKFYENQENQITKRMENTVNNLLVINSGLAKDDWKASEDEIRRSIISNGSFQGNLYIINNSEAPEIIASYSSRRFNQEDLVGKSPFQDNTLLNQDIILEALEEGKISYKTFEEDKIKHLAYPVENEFGKVKGIIYVTADLENMYETLDDAQEILTKATLLALFITIFLGFFIANSITGPIKDVTVKAARMAKGDFDQVVEVKSNDEIGQLASMFNYLTLKLKRTMSEVYREKSKLDTIFTYMADGVIAVNINGTIIHVNPNALKMLGITEEEVEHKTFDEIFVKYNPKLTLSYIKENNDWKGSYLLDMDPSVYRAKYASFRNKNNEIGGLIIVLQDVTEQQKLENMRKEFVANVSHELKTPITTIKSYTETLLDGGMESPELSNKFLDVIDSECDRMARIVRDLLQLSNLDYKQTKWNKSSLYMENLLRDAYFKMKIAAQEKNQKITLDIQGDIPQIAGDKDRLEQVVLNVISNAIKYTPDDGEIEIIAKKQENHVIVTVKDNGLGIPEEDIDRIFERFYRVDKARSRALGGTGLGLSIAKQIVVFHGGDIKIRSEYNVGTEVDIILPIQ
ncbi:ATP-binding protein [Sporosalibacterium faouarense]|uniref:ATP-binding protein n=1 Tax=Sporosalibacterium faouarense TaxID=516123 RepID=UPI00141D03BB|nr:ATP-binding protein [Sporosalibacterium faouarense]MTI46241.1 cell wall metabolism sensor histidine kinase WalK [Bacillota bacterium]